MTILVPVHKRPRVQQNHQHLKRPAQCIGPQDAPGRVGVILRRREGEPPPPHITAKGRKFSLRNGHFDNTVGPEEWMRGRFGMRANAIDPGPHGIVEGKGNPQFFLRLERATAPPERTCPKSLGRLSSYAGKIVAEILNGKKCSLLIVLVQQPGPRVEAMVGPEGIRQKLGMRVQLHVMSHAVKPAGRFRKVVAVDINPARIDEIDQFGVHFIGNRAHLANACSAAFVFTPNQSFDMIPACSFGLGLRVHSHQRVSSIFQLGDAPYLTDKSPSAGRSNRSS